MENSILSKRLRLDILTIEDHSFIRVLVNTKGWLDFIGDRKVDSAEAAIAYVEKIITTSNLFYWVVRVKEGDIAVGIISFMKRSYLDNFDIGFAFLPEHNGKGYACEAANAVLEMLRQYPAYYPVLATTMPQNLSSIKLLNKLGFHFEKEIEVEGVRLLVYTNADEKQTEPLLIGK